MFWVGHSALAPYVVFQGNIWAIEAFHSSSPTTTIPTPVIHNAL